MNTFFLPGAYIIQSVSKKKLHPHFLSFAQKFVQFWSPTKGHFKRGKEIEKKFALWKLENIPTTIFFLNILSVWEYIDGKK